MEEIEKTKNVILGSYSSVHDRIYYSSNEDLDSLFDSIDVKDKSVLTVLGSGDQLFHLSCGKPKTIDTFDINVLAKNYYYLRRWSILYNDEYYPNVFSNESIYHLLEKVTPVTEEEYYAYSYWKEYIQTFYPYMTKDLFNSSSVRNKITYLKRLKEQLLSHDIHFYGMDISKEKIDNHYDLIVLSNILEYYSLEDYKIKQVKDHLLDMLNEKGEVLISYYMDDGPSYLERKNFDTAFDSKKIYNTKNIMIGCVYQKRLSTKNS